jgi:hypothetical protein
MGRVKIGSAFFIVHQHIVYLHFSQKVTHSANNMRKL